MMPRMDPFKNRVAVITGGAGGIGSALARAFAARGSCSRTSTPRTWPWS